MPKPKYLPQFRAEDNFRLTLFPNHRSCLWNPNASNSIPKEWTRTQGNNNRKKMDRKKYNDHLEVLNNAFVNANSPFELKFSDVDGIGVYCKRDISVKEYKDSFSHLLSGFCQDRIEGVHFSNALLLTNKRKRGRPSKDASTKTTNDTTHHEEEESETPILPVRKSPRLAQTHSSTNRSKQKDTKDDKQSNHKNESLKNREVVSLFGPISFINHACNSKHSHFNLRQNKSKSPILVIKKKLKKNDQVHFSYGSDYNDVKCMKCFNARNKLK